MRKVLVLFAAIALLASCENQTADVNKIVFSKRHWLIGDWQAVAFNGIMHNSWSLEDSVLFKAAHYVEGGDTTYSEISVIAVLDSLPVLRVVPINDRPQEYPCVVYEAERMVFESDVRKEPFRIVMQKTGQDTYTQTNFSNDEGIEYENQFLFEKK
ncbi:MAG: hypothetical protein MRY78_10730 [Saprospiraceae bacterium]|nr:hypothetical protein [Saprospiraceae bacterium]